MKTFFSIISFVLTISFYSLALAAPSLTISPSSDSVFVLQGTDFQGVGGLDITISYNTTTLANPRVAQGSLLSGTSFIPNTGLTGAVRMVAITTKGINGSGPIATITFDLKGSSPGNIISMTGSLIDGNSKPIVARFQVNNPTATDSSTAKGSDSTTNDVTVAPPAAKTSEETVASQPVKAHQVEPAAPAREARAEKTAPEVEKKYTVINGIIDRFRDFQGEKTPQALIALAKTDKGQAFSQAPPISLSDGETKVKVTLKVDGLDKSAPNIALEGASLVNMEKQGENSWLIVALPNKGVYQANLTVMDGQAITTYPLTVAPPVAVKITKSDAALSEKDFALFLKERGTEKNPRFDLDGDGNRTYIDEYIYTLNYIVGLKGK